MRRTLLAVAFALLVSMLFAPHGDKFSVKGWGLFFSNYGFYTQTKWGILELHSLATAALAG